MAERVATVSTSGAFALDSFQRDPVANPLLVGAFRQSIRGLTDSDEFRNVFLVEAGQAAAERKVQSNDPITLAGATPGARAISEAQWSRSWPEAATAAVSWSPPTTMSSPTSTWGARRPRSASAGPMGSRATVR